MGTVVKAIRHVIVKGITPRMEKFSSIHVQEACLIFDVLRKKKVKMSEILRDKKKVRNFPRNEYAYLRETEGGKNE